MPRAVSAATWWLYPTVTINLSLSGHSDPFQPTLCKLKAKYFSWQLGFSYTESETGEPLWYKC